MKISNFNNTVVERTGLADDGRFKIAFNAKMAKILSDGLYSDKITSIIRELACNSMDSHIAAGKQSTPIEVHLPGVFEPWFHVRDFGIGLDHDEVMNIYTCYGASTKTDSNDFTGQLGLGSKSPFSYVDAFDVTAIKNGVMRQYSMYRSEDGMPSVALLLEQPTTESNGVTVKMPVLQNDFNNFKTKAANVFRWFDVKPTVVGMSNFDVKPVDVRFSGTSWKIRTRVAGGYYNLQAADAPMALMGRVAYPIQPDSITGLSKTLKTLASLPLVLDFDIGDLEIAASREALGYDARTQSNIKDKLEIVLRELGEQFEKQMADAKTLWQAHAAFNKIFGYDSRYEFETIFGNHGLKWNGHVIKNGGISVETATIYDSKMTSAPSIVTISGNFKRCRKMEYHRTLYLKCSKNTKIIFDDLDRGGASRVNYYHEKNHHNFEIYVFGGTPIISRKEILELLGNPEYELTSNLPKRPTATTAKGERINMLVHNPAFRQGKKAWDAADVDIDDGGIYVDLNTYTPVYGKREMGDFNDIIHLAKSIGILDKDTVIYAPRGSFKKKLEQMPEWENVFDVIAKGLKTRLTPAKLQNVSDVEAWSTALSHVNHSMIIDCKWNLIDTNGVFGSYINGMRLLRNTYNTTKNDHSLIRLNMLMGYNATLPTPSFDSSAAWTAVAKNYPLLPMMMENHWNVDMMFKGANLKHIVDYVNMVDASRALPARTKLAA